MTQPTAPKDVDEKKKPPEAASSDEPQLDPLQYLKEKPPEVSNVVPKQFGATPEMFDSTKQQFPALFAADKTTVAAPTMESSVERNDAQQLTKVVDAQGRTTTFERGQDGAVTSFRTGNAAEGDAPAMKLAKSELVGKNGETYNEYTLANGQTWRGRIETDKPAPGQVTFTKFEGEGENAVAAARVTHRPDGTTHSEYPSSPGSDARVSVDTRADGVVSKVTDQNGVEYTGSRLTFDAATREVSYTSAGGNEVTIRPDGSREVVNADKSRVELDTMGRPTQTFDANNKPIASYTYDKATGEATAIFVHQARDGQQVGEYKNVDGKWVRPEDNVTLGATGDVKINFDGSYSVKTADGGTERRNTDGSIVTSHQLTDTVNGQQVQVDKVTHVTTADGKNFDFIYGTTPEGKLEVQSVTNREGTWTTDLSQPEGPEGRQYARMKDGKPVLDDKGNPITWDGKISVNEKGEYSYSTKLENGEWGTVSELTNGTQRIEDPTLSGAIERNDGGQIVRVTNARGETTEFTSWDANGNPTQFKDYQGKTWTNENGIWTNNKTTDQRAGEITVDQHTGDVIFTDFNGKRDISRLDGSRFAERPDGSSIEVGSDGYLKAVNTPGEKKDSPAERFEYTHAPDGTLTSFKMPDGRTFQRNEDGTYTDGKTVVKDLKIDQTQSWSLGNLQFTDAATSNVMRYNTDGSETIANSQGQLEQIKQGNGDTHKFSRSPIYDSEGNVTGEQTTLTLQNGSQYTSQDGKTWTGTDKGTNPPTVRSDMSVIAAGDGYLAISGGGHYETYLSDGSTRLESHTDTTSRSVSTDRYGRLERLQDGSGNTNSFEYNDSVPGGISRFHDERGTWKTTDGQNWSLIDPFSEKPIKEDGKPVESAFTLSMTRDSFSQKMLGGDTIEKIGDGKMRVTKLDGMVLNYDSYKDKDGNMQQVLRDSVDQSGKKISYDYTMPGPGNDLTKPALSLVTVRDANGQPIKVNGEEIKLHVRQEDGLNVAYKSENFDPATRVGEFNVGDNGRPRMTLVDGRTAELQLDGSTLLRDKSGKLSGIVGTNTGDMLNNYTDLQRDASGQIVGVTKGNEHWQAVVENGKVTGWERMTGTQALDAEGKPKFGENHLPVMQWTPTGEKAKSVLVDDATGAVSIYKDGSWITRQATGVSTESFRTSTPTGSIADIFPDRIINRNEKGEIVSTQAGLLSVPTKFDDPRALADRPQNATGPTFVSNGFDGMQMNKDGTWSKVQLNNKGEWVPVAGGENQKISLQVNPANGDRTWVGTDGKPVKIDHANNEKTVFNTDGSTIRTSSDGKTTTYVQAEVNGVKREVTVGPKGTDVSVIDANSGLTTVMHQDVDGKTFTTRTYQNGVELPTSIANPIVQTGKITVNTTNAVGQVEITATGANGGTRQFNMNGSITDLPPTVVVPEKPNLNAGGPMSGGLLNPLPGPSGEGPVVKNPDGTVVGTKGPNDPIVVNNGATLSSNGIGPTAGKKDVPAETIPTGVDASIKARQEATRPVVDQTQVVPPVRSGGPQADAPTFEQARNQAKVAADAAAAEAAKKLATANTDLAKLNATAEVLHTQQQKVETSQAAIDQARGQQFLANQQLETLRRDAATLAGRTDLSTADLQRQAEITRNIATAEKTRQEALQLQGNLQIAKAEELRVVAETQRKVADQLTSPVEQTRAIAQADAYRQATLQVQAEARESAAQSERAKLAVAEATNNSLQAQRQVEQRAVESAKTQATTDAQKADQAKQQLGDQQRQVADAQREKDAAQAKLNQLDQQKQQQQAAQTPQQVAERKAAEEKLQAATTRLETEQTKLKAMTDATTAAVQKADVSQAAVVAAEKRLEQTNTALREMPPIETLRTQSIASAVKYEQEAQVIRGELERIRVASGATVTDAVRTEPVVVRQPIVTSGGEQQRDVAGGSDIKAMPLNQTNLPGQVISATVGGVNAQGQVTTADGKILLDSQGKPVMADQLRNFTATDGKIIVVDGKAISNTELSNMSVDQLRGLIANMPRDRVGELAMMLPPDKAAQLGLRTDPGAVPVNTEIIKQGGQIVVPPSTGNAQDPLKAGTGTGVVIAIDPSKVLGSGTGATGNNANGNNGTNIDPKTGAPVATDPKTGVPVATDPKTGAPVATDPKTGTPVSADPAKSTSPIAIDPKTGASVVTDPKTGAPVATDPKTGAPVATDPKTGAPVATDPKTGVPVATDPKTGAPVTADPAKSATPIATDPKTGVPVATDPKTGASVVTDPKTGAPVATDPKTGAPIATDPKTGAPVATDPKTGVPVATDPKTGAPVATDPKTGAPVATDPKTGAPVATDPKTGATVATDPKTGTPVTADPAKSATPVATDPKTGAPVATDPKTGAPVATDPKTGAPVATDPKTGTPVSADPAKGTSPIATDPKTGAPVVTDPKTGAPVATDPKTGAPVATDPKTGTPVSADPAKGTSPIATDPKTGAPVATDPKTGAPVATDPKTGAPVATDPKTGAPVATDPKTGAPVATDPKTGAPVATDPKTGAPVATDPKTGAPVATDPKTGTPVATDPKTGTPVSADPAKTTSPVATDPKTGLPVATDPKTGTVVSADPAKGTAQTGTTTTTATDPKTGLPVATDPKTGTVVSADPAKGTAQTGTTTTATDPKTGAPVATDPKTGLPVTTDPKTGTVVSADPAKGTAQTGTTTTATDPKTGAPVATDPKTGLPVATDPKNGTVVSADPAKGTAPTGTTTTATDPKTGAPVATDPKTGLPVATDPKTGTVVSADPAKGTAQTGTTTTATDPKTGAPVATDPKTGLPVATDPKTGTVVSADPAKGTAQTGTTTTATDPKTGAPVTTDPKTGLPVATDPKTGTVVSADPAKGTAQTGTTTTATDPKTGAPVTTDPKTGLPVATDPSKATVPTNSSTVDQKAPTTSADPGKATTTATGTNPSGVVTADQKTGTPVATDPKSGAQLATDPKNGPVVSTDPKTGTVTITDPKTGISVSIDPSKVVPAVNGNGSTDPSNNKAVAPGTTTGATAEPGNTKQNTVSDPNNAKQTTEPSKVQTTSTTNDPNVKVVSTSTVASANQTAPSYSVSTDKNGTITATATDTAGAVVTTIAFNTKTGMLVSTVNDPATGKVVSVTTYAPGEAGKTYTQTSNGFVYDPTIVKAPIGLPTVDGVRTTGGSTWSVSPDATGKPTYTFNPGDAPVLRADSGLQTGGSFRIRLDGSAPQTGSDAPFVIRLGAGIRTSVGDFEIEFVVPTGYVPQQGGTTVIMLDPETAAQASTGNTRISYVTEDGKPANIPASNGSVLYTDYDGRLLQQPQNYGTVEVIGVQPSTGTVSNIPNNGNTQHSQYPINIGSEDVSVGIGINPATGNPTVQIGLGPVDIVLGGGSANQQPTNGQYPQVGEVPVGQLPTTGQYPSTGPTTGQLPYTEPVVNIPSSGTQQPAQTQYPINFGNGDVNVGIGINPTTGSPSLQVGIGPIGFEIGGSPSSTAQPAPVTDPYNSGYQPPNYSNSTNVPTNNGSYVDPYGAEHWYDPLGLIVKTLTPDGTNVIYNDDGSRLVYGGNSPAPAFIPPPDNVQINSGTQVPVTPVSDPYVGTPPVNYGTPITPPVSYSDPLQPPYGGYPVNDPYLPNPGQSNFTPQPTPPLPFEPVTSTPSAITPTPSDPVASTPSPAAHDPLQPAQQQQNVPVAQQPEQPEDIANKLTVNFEPLRPEVAEEKPVAKAPIIVEDEKDKDSSGSLLSDYEHRIRENQNVVHNDGAEGLKGAGIDALDSKNNVSAAEATAMAAETQAAINALMQHLSNERRQDYTEAVQEEDRKYSEIAEDLRESKERESDTYRKHAELIADLRERELEGYKQKADAAQERKDKEEDAKKLTDTMMTLMANRRENDAVIKARQDAFWAEQQKKEEQVRQDNKQTKYLVRPNDTIESIAGKRLRDPRLAELIYQINKDKIEIKYENGKKVYVVKEGCVLTLPSPRQIREFRQQQRLGVLTQQDTSENVVAIDAKTAADQRRANVEKLLGKIGNAAESATNKYNVRLGDTLRSVAMKHPQLGDVTLWKLLAEKNGLPTNTDHKGVPTAALRRGTQINLPTTEEIAQYRNRMRGESITSWNSSRYETQSRQCPNCQRLTTTEASNCPGCSYAFDGIGKEVDVEVKNQPLIAASTISATITSAVPVPRVVQEDVSESTTISLESDEEENTVITGGKGANSFNVLSENLDPDERKWVEETIINSLIEKLGDNCRVVETTSPDNNVVRTQLEVLTGDTWIPILSYEINENTSVRHEFASDGKQRTMPIDLPAAAAQELIHNDLQSNWQEYCRKFLAGKRLTA